MRKPHVRPPKDGEIIPRCDAIVNRDCYPNSGKRCVQLGRYNGKCGHHILDQSAGCVDTVGYRVIYVGGRRVREHRYVMEQMIGRRLDPREVVHHKNGNKLDNRPANLQLMTWAQHSATTARELGLCPPLPLKSGMISRQPPAKSSRKAHK